MSGRRKQLIFFGTAALAGLICTIFLKEMYLNEFVAFYQNGRTMKVNNASLWPVVVWSRGKDAILVSIVSLTGWSALFYNLFSAWKGWLAGMTLGVNLSVFGVLGIWQTMLLGFPHMIVYALWWIVFMKHQEQKRNRITEVLPSVVLLLVLFMGGTLLEAYVNPVIFYALASN